jgi:hypothetical protein
VLLPTLLLSEPPPLLVLPFPLLFPLPLPFHHYWEWGRGEGPPEDSVVVAEVGMVATVNGWVGHPPLEGAE